MELLLSILIGVIVFWAIMITDAWVTNRHAKGPGHWFQQHWSWQFVRELRWLFQKKPPTQHVHVVPAVGKEHG